MVAGYIDPKIGAKNIDNNNKYKMKSEERDRKG
jgi:hypothetical protein